MKYLLFLLLFVLSMVDAASAQTRPGDLTSPPRDSLLQAGITGYIDGRYAGTVAALQGLADSSAQAAYYLGLMVVVPRRQEPDLRAYVNHHKEDEPWLRLMVQEGQVLFVADVMELLERGLEGKKEDSSPRWWW